MSGFCNWLFVNAIRKPFLIRISYLFHLSVPGPGKVKQISYTNPLHFSLSKFLKVRCYL